MTGYDPAFPASQADVLANWTTFTMNSFKYPYCFKNF